MTHFSYLSYPFTKVILESADFYLFWTCSVSNLFGYKWHELWQDLTHIKIINHLMNCHYVIYEVQVPRIIHQNVAAIDGIVKVNRKFYSIGPREWGSSWTWLDNYVVRFDKISLELTRRRLIYARTFVSLLSSHPTLIFWVKKYLWVEFFPVVSNKVKLLGDGVSLGEMSSWLLDYVWNICPFTIYRNENLPKSKQ